MQERAPGDFVRVRAEARQNLEILYDVDVGAREQAEASGVAFHRIASLNADPGLVAALAAVATGTIGSSGTVASGGRATTISVGGESR